MHKILEEQESEVLRTMAMIQTLEDVILEMEKEEAWARNTGPRPPQ